MGAVASIRNAWDAVARRAADGEANSPSGAAATTTRPGSAVASRRRRRAGALGAALLIASPSHQVPRVGQQEQTAEDPDPHEVDEVPVVAHRLEDVDLAGIAAGSHHAPVEEHHGN